MNPIEAFRELLVRTLLFFAFALPATCLAQTGDYTPLRTDERGKQFRVQYIGGLINDHLVDKVRIGPFGASIQLGQNEQIVFSGQDRNRKTWSVELAPTGQILPYELYVADLDRNGYSDGILISPTGGNGLAPTSHIITLMFDSSGRPILFEADGYFSYHKLGITDLVDMDRDRKAELIYMNFDDGYWITNVYEAGNGRWNRISGRLGSRAYPLFTRFTIRRNHNAVTPPRWRHPFAPDLSNVVPKTEGQLVSYQLRNISRSEDILLTIKTRTGKTELCKPVSWHSSFAVVVDDAEGRRVASLAAGDEAMQKLLDQTVSKQYRVALFGQRQSSQCSPEVLWAQEVLR